jgi:hypothetical protein
MRRVDVATAAKTRTVSACRTTAARVAANARWNVTGHPRANPGLSCRGTQTRQDAVTTAHEVVGLRCMVRTGQVPVAQSTGTRTGVREWVRWNVGQATANSTTVSRTAGAGTPAGRDDTSDVRDLRGLRGLRGRRAVGGMVSRH